MGVKILAAVLVVAGCLAALAAFFLIDWRAGVAAVGVLAIVVGSVVIPVEDES